MRRRLSLETLDHVAAECARPAYDIASVRVGIVHLGIGAFHRAHQAVYVDDRLAAGEKDWAICGASLRSPDAAEALTPQDGLYAVSVQSGADEQRLRVIGSVRRVLAAPHDPAALLATMSDSRVHIVSLTITEKGYCHDPATGDLRPDHPDIAADLAAPERPRSAPGVLLEALRRRRAAGVAPAAARHGSHPAGVRRADHAARARGGRLDALRDRNRRARQRDRRA